ncbi:MAG: FtsK/SpoIIIE domain-containing protein [Actinomycetota bacterium]|nr:FtsK/SpoIIIE domain-containing protein [Actinomycetota bacterium]
MSDDDQIPIAAQLHIVVSGVPELHAVDLDFSFQPGATIGDFVGASRIYGDKHDLSAVEVYSDRLGGLLPHDMLIGRFTFARGETIRLSGRAGDGRPNHTLVTGDWSLIDLTGPHAGRVTGIANEGSLTVLPENGRTSAGQPSVSVSGTQRGELRLTSMGGAVLAQCRLGVTAAVPHSPGEPVRCGSGTVFNFSGVTLQLVLTSEARRRLSADGQFAYAAAVKLEPIRPETPSVSLPSLRQHENRSTSWPIESMLTSGLTAGVFVLLFHRLTLLVLLAVPVVIGGVSWFRQRKQREEESARLAKEYKDELDAAKTAIGTFRDAEQQIRCDEVPSIAGVVSMVSMRTDGLWSRKPAGRLFLVLRVGTTSLDSAVQLRGGDAEAREAATSAAKMRQVPACVDLKSGHIAVAGLDSEIDAFMQLLLLQLASLHAPHTVELVVLLPARNRHVLVEFDWMKWLPHVQGAGISKSVLVGADAIRKRISEIRDRLEQSARTSTRDSDLLPHVVIVAHEAAELPSDLLSQVLTARPENTHLLWFGSSAEMAPVETDLLLEVVGSDVKVKGGPAEWEEATWWFDKQAPDAGAWARDQEVRRASSDDLVSTSARFLAPLRDVRRSAVTAGIASSVSFASLIDQSRGITITPIAEGLTFVPGSGIGGPVVLDLVRHGPHMLIGGTTGAGKSELLQTIIGSMAGNYPPEQLSMLFFDFKGGASLGPVMRLPHCLGTVTNLDGLDLDRALAFIQAEILYRMQLIAARSAEVGRELADYRAYLATNPEKFLPRLVTVFDEFAALVGEFPRMLGGVLRAAQQGRSLGVHLILATQRPSRDVVTPDIRANIPLRIALQTVDPSESLVIIDSEDAAFIPSDLKGRGFIRLSRTELIEFQSGYASSEDPGPNARTAAQSAVFNLLPPTGSADQAPAAGDPRPTAIELHVAKLRNRFSGFHYPRVLKTAPANLLPIDAADLEPSPSPGVLTLGLLDEPRHQRQGPYRLDLTRGGALVAGGLDSGKSNAARLVTHQLRTTGPLDLVIIGPEADIGPPMGIEASWIVGSSDRESLGLLRAQIARDLPGRTPHSRPILIVVEDLDSIADIGDTDNSVREVSQLIDTVSRARSKSIYIVATARRTHLLGGRIRGAFPHLLQLQAPEELDSYDGLASDLPQGVAIVDRGRATVRLAYVPPGDADATAVTASEDSVVGPVPATVDLRGTTADAVVLGRDAVSRRLMTWSGWQEGRHLWVRGPELSGRSSALARTARRIAELSNLPITVLAPPESRIRRLFPNAVCFDSGADALVHVEAQGLQLAPSVVIIDDDYDPLRCGAARAWAERGSTVLVRFSTDGGIASSWSFVTGRGDALVLGNTSAKGTSDFRGALPGWIDPASQLPPGRALYSLSGAVGLVQLGRNTDDEEVE